MPTLTNCQTPEPRGATYFCRLEPEPLEKIPEAGSVWGINQAPEPLENKLSGLDNLNPGLPLVGKLITGVVINVCMLLSYHGHSFKNF